MKKILIVLLFVSKLLPASLIVSFDGKGLAMAWDVGVISALIEKWNAGKVGEVYLAGSSSGSIISSYFACRGLTQAAVQEFKQQSNVSLKDLLDEDAVNKTLHLFLDINPEVPLSRVKPIIDIATQNGQCLPTTPLLIAASNLDILDTRKKNKPFGGTYDRSVDKNTYLVSQGNKVLGKACTYFVNESMAKILEGVPGKKGVPENERLCDLRYIRTPQDLILAIHSSISEPTYFSEVYESTVNLVRSLFPVSHDRRYGGGFIINSAVQDIKRALPEAYVFGTGRTHYTRVQNRIIANWFSDFSMNETWLNQRWFFDEQIPLTRKEWDSLYEKKTTPTDQINRGHDRALECFKSEEGCVPKLSKRPLYSKGADEKPLDKLRARTIKALF